MKRLIAILLTLVMIFALSACGDKKTADDQKTEKTTTGSVDIHATLDEILELVKDEEPSEMDEGQIESIYNIQPQWVEDFACAYTMSGVFSGEILMFEAKDKNTKENIRVQLEARLADVREQSKDYDEASYKNVQTCKVLENGNFLALFISDKHVEMEELFNK